MNLYDAFLLLSNRQECENFLKDLCTPKELKDFNDRWEIAKLLDEGRLSYREIAGMMNIPTGTVRSRISTGRKLLKRWLGQASPPIGLKNVTKQERTELSAKKRVTKDRTPEHSTDTTMRAIFLTELAMQYFPGNTQKSATNQLKRWIELNPELRARLSELHYRKGQRALTPLQHAAIVRFLGEPG